MGKDETFHSPIFVILRKIQHTPRPWKPPLYDSLFIFGHPFDMFDWGLGWNFLRIFKLDIQKGKPHETPGFQVIPWYKL